MSLYNQGPISIGGFLTLPVRKTGNDNIKAKAIFKSIIMQGLFVPFARTGSGDPVRVLRLLHNKYTGYN